MNKNSDSIDIDSSPRASLGNDEADQAGTCFSQYVDDNSRKITTDSFHADIESGNIEVDRFPRASLGNDEADQAGTCFPRPIPLNMHELYEQLVARGLSFGERDEQEALKLLQTVGYYHLRGYWITFEDGEGFLEGTTIDQVLDIMRLDEDFAELILSAVTPVELALRSALSQALVSHAGAFALETSNLFKDSEPYKNMKTNIARELRQGKRNKSTFVLRNLDKYGRLPVWAAMELTSLGTASKIFGNISDVTLRNEIAKVFNIKPRYLKNWLRCVTPIRNMSAHHDRLYNKKFSTLPALHKEYANVDRSRLFAQIIVLLRLHDAVRPAEAGSIRLRLKKIIESHKSVDLRPIGFPEDWREILGIPTHPIDKPRVRGRKGGRPPKDEAAIEEALFLYDMKTDSISEICRKTNLSSTTLYKYVKLRNDD